MELTANKSGSIGAFALVAALIALIPSALAHVAASAGDPVTRVDARTRKEVLDQLARELESRYAVPDTAERLAQAVWAKQRSNAYKNVVSAPELARALTDDLRVVAHDKHLRVIFSFNPVPQEGTDAGPPPAEVIQQMRKLNGLIPKVEILDGNVGYMRVNGVPYPDAGRDAVAAAFAFLHSTDALIIDNRGNGGGEELTYDLQVFKRGVVVGEVTGGGANPGGPVPLGHQFVVNMPGAQAVNPVTGTSW